MGAVDDAALDDAALQPYFLMTFSLGLTIDGLREIALKFHENYDLLADVAFAAESSPIQAHLRRREC